jgi:DNA invertase Pin-like site-specific DNA recombinase
VPTAITASGIILSLSKLSCLRHSQGLSVLLCWSISRLRRVPVIAHLLMRQSSQSIAKLSELSCLRQSQGLSVILCWSISRLRRVPVIAHLLMRQSSQSIAKLTELSCLRHSQGLFTGSARLSKLSCLRHSQGLSGILMLEYLAPPARSRYCASPDASIHSINSKAI